MTRRRIRAKLTYANITATLALAAALGTGGAYAASSLSKNSVGPKQIRKNAVRSSDIKNHSVSTRDLSKRARGGHGRIERANVVGDGSKVTGTARSVTLVRPNTYTVAFKRDVSRCSYAATLFPFDLNVPDGRQVTISGKGGTEVTISTFDAAGSPTPSGFDLIVAC